MGPIRDSASDILSPFLRCYNISDCDKITTTVRLEKKIETISQANPVTTLKDDKKKENGVARGRWPPAAASCFVNNFN